ncbi:MAG: hypothetical protein LH471_08685, partial [Salinibacterium sp.]|nr:hypothetical protein [Salinibacterium sp.]
MSDENNDRPANTPPPLVPPPVRVPATRANETDANQNTSVDAERDSELTVEEPVSARVTNDSADHTPVAASDDSRFAPDASRSTGSEPA